MKKLLPHLLFALLVVGCDNSTNSKEKYFMCTWEYEDGQSGCFPTIFQSMSDCEEASSIPDFEHCQGTIPYTGSAIDLDTGEINYNEFIDLPLVGCKEYTDTTTCLVGFIPPQ